MWSVKIRNRNQHLRSIRRFSYLTMEHIQFILTDNNTEFINRVVKAFAEEHNITHTIVLPYPQANSIERVNRTLKTMMISFIEQNHREWDKYLSEFRLQYCVPLFSWNLPCFPESRTKIRADTIVESSQSYEVESRDISNWSERMKKLQFLREWVTNLDRAYQRQSARYNLRRHIQVFWIGDLVLKRQHILLSAAQNVMAKLAHKFQGLFA